MFIKSIIIDGFKSYANRVEINGFDPQFNAITGLNGTGKSNILDSICFVLGISNLSHVRANNLTDLVFKSGQAGIKKATVTVIFDNRDRTKSPSGYESYEEITVTRQIYADQAGRNRYMINGSTVQNQRVKDLFESVQLNVNNPHFLIMQGRITKVLNMKPPEILSMIEEAAGTSMYEKKKLAAEKTIEKKDAKLNHLNEILQGEIGPRIERLKQERLQYFELQKLERELDHCSKIHIAYTYLRTEKKKEQTAEKLRAITQRITDMKDRKVQCENEMKEMDQNIAKLQEIRDKQMGGKLQEIETELKDAEKAEAVVAATCKTSKTNLTAEEKKLKQLEKSLADDTATFDGKKKQLDGVKGVFDKMKEEEQTNLEAYEAAKRKFQAVSSGLFSDDGGGDNATLEDQLMQVKGAIAQAEIDRKQCAMQMDHQKNQLKTKSAEVKKTESTFANDKKQLEKFEREIQNFETEMNRLNYQDGLIEQLKEERKKLIMELNPLKHKKEDFDRRNHRLNFRYTDPEPNFKHSAVRGLVCKLFRSKNPEYNMALETLAGGKLYNVVVETQDISEKLIKNGQLTHRQTFIPMNQIRGSRLSDQVIKSAKNTVGADKVHSALSLIEFDPQYQKVMEFIFGEVFVCEDYSVAHQLALNSPLGKKCVSKQGDVCDPGGVVSGGAPPASESVLALISENDKCCRQFDEKNGQLRAIDEQINAVSRTADRFNNVKEQKEIKEQELKMLKERLEHTSHYQQKAEVDALTASIEALTKKIEECTKIEQENAKKVTTLESKMKNIKSIRDKELKTAEAEMKRLKKKSDESRETWQKREQEFAALKLEIEELEKSIENGRSQVDAATEALNKLKEDLQKANQEYEAKKQEVAAIQNRLKNEKQNINKQNDEIQKIVALKDERQTEIEKIKLTDIKVTNDKDKIKDELEAAEKMLKDLVHKHEWIETDKGSFGKPNGIFDFEQYNPKEIASKLPALQERKAKLGRAVNARAVNLLGKEEEQFQELLKKKEIVEADKAKIVAVIKELEEKKNAALQFAWERVNKDFGSIFGKLLPGANAKLATLPGKTVLDGLEVKVAFGSIWKESLSELSGGQRSLVALSFILAMLLFKPAPIYILDEVDAALDLSHTQNIGQMLKAHFTHSQFIVVSLKEGMFNNANVLFRTRFVDGMSQVIRTTPNRS
ncbi:structural maintenance of chromosomes protein 2 [Planococcus citri]|uniref:structural maintenance of chromosomes protein 2 n=1 Tax=Planococcus citri TaxID=170843 RepID=UPI0031F73DE3